MSRYKKYLKRDIPSCSTTLDLIIVSIVLSYCRAVVQEENNDVKMKALNANRTKVWLNHPDYNNDVRFVVALIPCWSLACAVGTQKETHTST